jgi:nucleotide-binding universal stress UspA family protein
MFEKIVLATDLSPHWDQIIGCADQLRALGCTRAILTHVIISKGLVGADATALSGAEPKLESQRKQLESHGFEVVTETPVGLPAFSLNEVAERQCASLIVVGSHGKSAWREAILGSVSNAVLHHARFPTLLLNVKRLRDEERGGSCQLKVGELLRHVLFPTDFSNVAINAATYLEYLVGKGLSELTLMHALEVLESYPPALNEPAEVAARTQLRTLAKHFEEVGVSRVHSCLSKDHPIPMVLETLKREHFSLVVMGAQGKSLLSELLLGSVAYNVARLAPCPVLLVPRTSI